MYFLMEVRLVNQNRSGDCALLEISLQPTVN
jgi:hypothetical protein